jgi:hypothetical protein
VVYLSGWALWFVLYVYVGVHEIVRVRSAWEMYGREKDGRQVLERWRRVVDMQVRPYLTHTLISCE